jgi:hypothetical protein
MLSSYGAGVVDQDVTSTVTPIDVPLGLIIPPKIVTPSEEHQKTLMWPILPENSTASSRQTLLVEVEESSIQRTAAAAKVHIDYYIVLSLHV